jgi:hypothetical protein
MRRWIRAVLLLAVIGILAYGGGVLYLKHEGHLTPAEFIDGVLNHSSSVEELQNWIRRETLGGSTYIGKDAHFLEQQVRNERDRFEEAAGEPLLKAGYKDADIRWSFEITCTDSEHLIIPSVRHYVYDLLFSEDMRVVGYREHKY